MTQKCTKHTRTELVPWDDPYDDLYEMYCPICRREEEKQREKELKKTCHICVALPRVEVHEQDVEMIYHVDVPTFFHLQHGGKKKRKGTNVTINGKTGYIVTAKKKTNLTVMK